MHVHHCLLVAHHLLKVKKGFKIQANVVRSLTYRELITRASLVKFGYIGLFLEPLGVMIIFLIIFSVIRRRNVGGNLDVLLFLISGIVLYTLFNAIAIRSTVGGVTLTGANASMTMETDGDIITQYQNNKTATIKNAANDVKIVLDDTLNSETITLTNSTGTGAAAKEAGRSGRKKEGGGEEEERGQ